MISPIQRRFEAEDLDAEMDNYHKSKKDASAAPAAAAEAAAPAAMDA